MTVAVIGGGPSLAAVAIEALRGHRFVVVNSGCRAVRPVATAEDILYFSDNSWDERRPGLAASWPGPVVTCNRHATARSEGRYRYINVSALTAEIGAVPDHVQASSGHVAACLAVVMGAKRIVLVAFDGAPVGDRTHGHDDYRQHDMDAFRERFLPGWRGLAAAFRRRDVEVVNATPGSAITDFPAMPLAEALR